MLDIIMACVGMLITAIVMAMVGIVIIGIVYYAFRDVKKQEKAYMDNSEYDWGHDVKHNSEEK